MPSSHYCAYNIFIITFSLFPFTKQRKTVSHSILEIKILPLLFSKRLLGTPEWCSLRKQTAVLQ